MTLVFLSKCTAAGRVGLPSWLSDDYDPSAPRVHSTLTVGQYPVAPAPYHYGASDGYAVNNAAGNQFKYEPDRDDVVEVYILLALGQRYRFSFDIKTAPSTAGVVLELLVASVATNQAIVFHQAAVNNPTSWQDPMSFEFDATASDMRIQLLC